MDVVSIFCKIMVCWVYSLESPRRDDYNDFTQHIFLWLNRTKSKKKSINICFLELSEEFPGEGGEGVGGVGGGGGAQKRIMKTCLYSNILRILPAKTKWTFQMKNSSRFHISARNIDCGYLEPPQQGGSNEYPQPMFWAEIWKLMYRRVLVREFELAMVHESSVFESLRFYCACRYLWASRHFSHKSSIETIQ